MQNFFKKYKNTYFVETGSFVGSGIQKAIDSNYENIISIELSDKYADICEKRFKDNVNVKIIRGDSAHILYDIIKPINSKITFWLDGHHSCGDTALGTYWAPLIQELEQIKMHHIKEHTICIDDMRCWEDPNEVHGFYKPDIFNKLKEINSNYTFLYENGHIENDVLVATII